MNPSEDQVRQRIPYHPSLVRRTRRWGALIALVTFAAALGAPALAVAPGRRTAAKKSAVPAVPTSWQVDRVHFNPIDGNLGLGGGDDYRGSLEVVRSGAGLAVVNVLPFEDYLKGISEVPTSWPAEAQKAQAIAARTYALSESLRDVPTGAKAAGADLCATDSCQVYAGLSKEHREGAGAWSSAVDATRGQVLLYRGEPIVAKYSSSNGGRSVAGGYPYLRATDDPDDRFSPLHSWKVQLPLEPVRAALGLSGPITRMARSGGTVAAVWTDADGVDRESDFAVADFRSRVISAVAAPPGVPQALPSSRFSVFADPANGVLVAEGNGWGHGLGMSQWGAYGKARRGMKAADILASYYGGLRPAWVPVPQTIKVAVALDQAAVVVGGGGRFRVTDGQGQALATSASGGWRLDATAKGIRVSPPADQLAAPSVVGARLESAPLVGQVSRLQFHLSGPALVTVSIVPPSGLEVVLASKEVGGGDIAQPLPPLADEGYYVANISVDAGLHRRGATAVPFAVTSLRTLGIPAAADLAGPRPPTGMLAAVFGGRAATSGMANLIALTLLVMVGTALVSTLRRVGLPRWTPLH